MEQDQIPLCREYAVDVYLVRYGSTVGTRAQLQCRCRCVRNLIYLSTKVTTLGLFFGSLMSHMHMHYADLGGVGGGHANVGGCANIGGHAKKAGGCTDTLGRLDTCKFYIIYIITIS